MSNQRIDSAEKFVTNDLLKDFGLDGALSVENAILISWKNYSIIEKEFTQPKEELLEYFQLPDYWFKLIKFIHYHIFNGVYRNAGEFRKISDRDSGVVYFGGTNNRELKSNYSGTLAIKIEQELFELCKQFTSLNQDHL